MMGIFYYATTIFDICNTKDRYDIILFFIASRQPLAFCAESTSVNVRAPKNCVTRHLHTSFLPCFAHQSALQCGDLLTLLSYSDVVAKSLKTVKCFNKSTSKCLLRLSKVMEYIDGRGSGLITGFVTRWTTTWMSLWSVLRAKMALHALFLLNEAEMCSLCEQSANENIRKVSDVVTNHDFLWRFKIFSDFYTDCQ